MTVLLGCGPEKNMSTDTDTGASGSSDTGAVTTGGESETATPTSGSDSSGGSTGAPVEDCAFLVGNTFLSDDPLECGQGPIGVELCNWRISFTADMFNHLLSDFGEQGTYTCKDGQITGDMNGQPRSGTIDAATGELVWETIIYHPEP